MALQAVPTAGHARTRRTTACGDLMIEDVRDVADAFTRLRDGDEDKRFLPTGEGAHGLYPSRDACELFASHREEGSITVIDFATGRIKKKWRTRVAAAPTWAGCRPTGSGSGSPGAPTWQ